jgi:deoxyadenosine/deoxycytidine kinase
MTICRPVLSRENQSNHIAVSGLVGAGKTTLIRKLSGAFGYAGLEERFEDNPYLAMFYRDPPGWVWKSYMFFFQRTLEDHITAQNTHGNAIQERTLEEHLLIFGEEYYARGYLTDSDITLLRNLTASVSSQLVKPDLLVHIDIEPDDALSRVRQRGSPVERGIGLEYLHSLYGRYDHMLSEWKGGIVQIDGTEDFLTDQSVVADIAWKISQAAGPRR